MLTRDFTTLIIITMMIAHKTRMFCRTHARTIQFIGMIVSAAGWGAWLAVAVCGG